MSDFNYDLLFLSGRMRINNLKNKYIFLLKNSYRNCKVNDRLITIKSKSHWRGLQTLQSLLLLLWKWPTSINFHQPLSKMYDYCTCGIFSSYNSNPMHRSIWYRLILTPSSPSKGIIIQKNKLGPIVEKLLELKLNFFTKVSHSGPKALKSFKFGINS